MIRVVAAKVSVQGKMEIVATAEFASPKFDLQDTNCTGEFATAIRSCIEEASAIVGLRITSAQVNIADQYLATTTVDSAVIKRPDPKCLISQSELDLLLHATMKTQAPGLNPIHVSPHDYSVDEFDDVRNPLGMTGETISATYTLLTVIPNFMKSLTSVTRKAGVKIKGLIPSTVAGFEACVGKVERERGVVLVDIGSKHSNLAVVDRGHITYSTGLPVAGDHFTNDLTIGLGVPRSAAEELKIIHGTAVVEGTTAQDFIDSSVLADKLNRNRVSRLTMNTLLRDRALELLALIMKAIYRSGRKTLPTGGLILTGGGSKLSGLSNLASSYLSCPVRVAAPMDILDLPNALRDPQYPVSIGLLLRGIKNPTQEFTKNGLLPQLKPSRLPQWASKFSYRRIEEAKV